jgi:hypothetical protein
MVLVAVESAGREGCGRLKKRIRNRKRSVNKKVIAIALAGRWKGPEGEERRVERYRVGSESDSAGGADAKAA